MAQEILYSQEFKLRFSECLGENWRTLGCWLKIEDNCLDMIDQDYTETKLKAYSLLSKWMQKNENPTLEELKTALRNMKRIDLVQKVDKLTGTFNSTGMAAEVSVEKDESEKRAALKSHYFKNYAKVNELRPPLNLSSSVDILHEFVELCLVNAVDVQMDAGYKVELMEFLKKHKYYKTIQYNKVFMEEKQSLLITGIAGIGKSWLLKKCLLDWANNCIWKNVEFVFYFECKMLNQYEYVSSIKELLHVLYKDFVQDLKINNHNVLFVIDGLDEFKYLDDLINSISSSSSSQIPVVNALAEIQKYKSVVAGRIHAIDCYQSVYWMPTANIERLTIQVMGFNENGIYKYIENNIKEDKKELAKNIFKDTPIAKSMASVPFYLSSMCKIIESESDFSFLTMTNLYASILLHFLKIHINKNEVPVYKMIENNINKQYILNVCKIAYEFFIKNKVVFTKEEMQTIIHDFDLIEDKLFGFIERIETDYGFYYQFAHLTIMEFCVSVYAYNTFSGNEIVANNKLRSCLSMICGLSNKSENNLIKFLDNLNRSNKRNFTNSEICGIRSDMITQKVLVQFIVQNIGSGSNTFNIINITQMNKKKKPFHE